MSYSIDWEQLWSFLIESLIRHGPDQIPEIRNALAAILGNPAEAPRIITGDAPPGYDDCFDALIGPFNQTMSSCFMDSTLISMFGFKNSPFYQKLVVEDVNVNSKFTACSNNRQEDADMRRQIQKLLREDVEVLMSGRKRFHCTNLRNILGGRCTKGGANKDLSMGTQDPAELYSRLLEALNYTPITVRTKTYRARDEEGTDEVFINQDETNVEMLPSLRAGDETIYAAAWPFTWQTEYDELPSSDRRNALLASRPFLKTVREIVHADVIVVHIDRSVAAGEVLPGESSLESLVNPLLSLLGGNAEEYESFEGFEGFEDVEPVDPTKRNETKVNPRPVSVQLEMEVDGSVYVLKSVVYSPRDGHYAALLHCGNNWFNYDDLAAHQPISRTPMPEEEVSVLVQTRGTLLFYYPIFMRERNPALAAVPAPSLLGMSVQNSNLASATTPLQNVTLGAKK